MAETKSNLMDIVNSVEAISNDENVTIDDLKRLKEVPGVLGRMGKVAKMAKNTVMSGFNPYDHEALTNAVSLGMSKAKTLAKAKANHEWYAANKDWKKQYNRDYYQRNKDYWETRYQMAKREYDLANKAIDVSGSLNLDKIKNTVDQIGLRNAAKADLMIAEQGKERADKEYDNFIRNHQDTNLITLWRVGANDIKNAGKQFINKLLGR